MKYRIVREGFLSYEAQVCLDSNDWYPLDTFLTKDGAWRYCLLFDNYYKQEDKPDKQKKKVVKEFEF